MLSHNLFFCFLRSKYTYVLEPAESSSASLNYRSPSFVKEKKFTEANTTVFESFVVGANNGIKTGVVIFPYVLAMLVAISLFRNSGLFEIISNWIAFIVQYITRYLYLGIWQEGGQQPT
jgi:hypothetical protein